MKFRLFLHKLTHWEYWPFNLIYYPLFPVWLYFSIRARSFFFFNAANPSIKNGGMAMESKMDIYHNIPDTYIPKTLLIKKGSSFDEVLSKIEAAGITFPLIAKPDIGMKSFGVEKVVSKAQLERHAQRNPFDFLIQQLIPYANEIGIFYVRMPDADQGMITGMVAKEFLTVVGDGEHTVRQLIQRDPRSHFQLHTLEKTMGDSLQKVLPKDEESVLVPLGSHTLGAKFVDVTYRKNDKLLDMVNTICTQIEGFYYGRLDILYNDFEELCEGKNFSIIEVNGAGSEATHIYDPKHSLFFAWREITRHWRYLYRISVANHKKGHPYLGYQEGRAMLRENALHEQALKHM